MPLTKSWMGSEYAKAGWYCKYGSESSAMVSGPMPAAASAASDIAGRPRRRGVYRGTMARGSKKEDATVSNVSSKDV